MWISDIVIDKEGLLQLTTAFYSIWQREGGTDRGQEEEIKELLQLTDHQVWVELARS